MLVPLQLVLVLPLLVLELLVQRLQDKEIACSLGVSIATVKTHLKHIYGKLGVCGRCEAVSKAENLGLLRMLRP